MVAAAWSFADTPCNYALCVGINEYDYIPSYNWLDGCVHDACKVWTNITTRGEWAPGNAALLFDGSATKDAIRDAITNAAAQAVSGDVFFYYHASHGGYHDTNEGRDVFLCAYDADYEDYELAEDLAKFRSGVKVVVMVDACNSGGLFKSKSPVRALSKSGGDAASAAPFDLAGRVGAAIGAIRENERKRGRRALGAGAGISPEEIGWITAADYDQDCWDNDDGGEFTSAVLKGWTTGLCDDIGCGDEDCYANFHELWNYAKDIATGKGKPGSPYYTEAQCTNTAVLLSVTAGWVGETPPPLAGDPPRLRPIADIDAEVGEAVSFYVRAFTPPGVRATLSISPDDVGATLEDGVFSFTPVTGGNYPFTVSATCDSGSGVTSTNEEFTVAVHPRRPESVRVEDVRTNSFTVCWTAVAGADGYWLEVDEGDYYAWDNLTAVIDEDVGDVTSYALAGLKPDTAYTIWLWASSDDNFSQTVLPVIVRTDREHVAPTWSALPPLTARAGLPYIFDLAPFFSGYPAPTLELSAGNATLSGTTLSFTPATTGTYTFTVAASNDAGVASASFEVEAVEPTPRKFALCVGINQYMHIHGLEGCVNDAKFLAANLVTRGGWNAADVVVLTDERATKSAIRGAISNVIAQAVAGDTFIYQHSSHGGQFNATEDDDEPLVGDDGLDTFLCVYDEDYYDNTTAYNDYEMAEDLAAFHAGVKVAMIVDACHSGGLFKDRGGVRAAAAPFDLAGRVSAIMETGRARRRARGENVARSLSASEIGWATAAEYYEYSLDGGFYHTDKWMSDPGYGDEYWVWDNYLHTDGHYEYPDSYRPGGLFLVSATWGWWSGSADRDATVGDTNGVCNVYEFWKAGHDICAVIGDFWGDPEYDYHPQCTNTAVLSSIDLGWTTPPTPIPALPADVTPEQVTSTLAGSADSSLVENVADAAAYSVYRAWAQTVKETGSDAAAGPQAVRDSPQAWLAFALGADALIGAPLTNDDVRIVGFCATNSVTEGGPPVCSLEIKIDGVNVGASEAVPDDILQANLEKVLGVEGAATPDTWRFSSAGIGVEIEPPADGKARLTATPPSRASKAFFMRAYLQ